jgi:hypothetical protein
VPADLNRGGKTVGADRHRTAQLGAAASIVVSVKGVAGTVRHIPHGKLPGFIACQEEGVTRSVRRHVSRKRNRLSLSRSQREQLERTQECSEESVTRDFTLVGQYRTPRERSRP